jgi:hypothetical protein
MFEAKNILNGNGNARLRQQRMPISNVELYSVFVAMVLGCVVGYQLHHQHVEKRLALQGQPRPEHRAEERYSEESKRGIRRMEISVVEMSIEADQSEMNLAELQGNLTTMHKSQTQLLLDLGKLRLLQIMAERQ